MSESCVGVNVADTRQKGTVTGVGGNPDGESIVIGGVAVTARVIVRLENEYEARLSQVTARACRPLAISKQSKIRDKHFRKCTSTLGTFRFSFRS
jgi:hypothetical protein